MTESPTSRMVYSEEGSVAMLTLCRAPMNAIDDLFLNTLGTHLDALALRTDLTILRFRSTQRVFCAGADLAVIGSRIGTAEGASTMVDTVRLFQTMYNKIAALPMVTLAEIEGHALGGGMELALACDLRIASHAAKLGLPEAKVGLLPGAGGTQRLTHLCGPGVAARVILTGELIGGEEAARIGMAQWSATPEHFAEVAKSVVDRTASMSPPALRIIKQCIQHAVLDMTAGSLAEVNGIGALMMEAETAKRVAGFLKK